MSKKKLEVNEIEKDIYNNLIYNQDMYKKVIDYINENDFHEIFLKSAVGCLCKKYVYGNPINEIENAISLANEPKRHAKIRAIITILVDCFVTNNRFSEFFDTNQTDDKNKMIQDKNVKTEEVENALQK
jgi:hypothetical protein